MGEEEVEEDQPSPEHVNFTWPEKVLFVILLAFSVMDNVADIASVTIYWKEKENHKNGLGIAIFATVSFLLGFPFFVAQAVITIRGWNRNVSVWMTNTEDSVNILKFCETTLESIPQLWISLYVLSLTARQPSDGSIILIISASFSYIMIITSAIKFDRLFEELVSANDTKRDTYSKLSSVFLYASKCVALAARVFVLVYLTVEVGWWTTLFILVHFTAIGILSCILYGDIETAKCRHLKFGSLSIILLEAVVSLFCWHVVSKEKSRYHIIFSLLFTFENICGLLLAWFYGIGDTFYLYDNVLAVNLSLDFAAVIFVFLYLIFQNRLIVPGSQVSVESEMRVESITDTIETRSVDPV